MLGVSGFVKEHFYLSIATCGIAVIGFLGYKAVYWLITKCGLVQKADQAALNSFKNLSQKQTIDLQSKWWTPILHSDEFTAFKKNWKALAFDQQAHKTAKAFKKSVQEIKGDAFFGPVLNVPAEFSFWMKGVAFIAAYLKAKKNIEGLFVCRELKGIESKIEEIYHNPNDQRAALIAGLSSEYPQYPQHKVCILIEKKAGHLTIALLDPMPESHNREIDPKFILMKSDKLLGYSVCNSKELIFRQIYGVCKRNRINACLLDSVVRRELKGGCAIFALQDAVAYLKDPNFLDKIHVSSETQIDEEYRIKSIDLLPPECLVGTQSFSLLDRYRQEGIDFDAPLLGRKKSLNAYLDQHKVIVKNKAQNHYITKKFFCYMKFLVQSLERFDEKEVGKLAETCLI